MVKSNKLPISINENYDGFQRHWNAGESTVFQSVEWLKTDIDTRR